MTATHLVIASAVPALRGNVPLPALPPLPNLDALLARLQPGQQVACDADDPDTPLERVLAQLHGLPQPPGHVPWAAFDTQTVNEACAWIRPCHWQLGMDSARVADPAMLALDEAESRALLATVAPHMDEAGITVSYRRPDAWLARSPLFAGLRTCSILRASQEPLSPELLAVSGTDGAATLRRMQNEWQMLLAGHRVNDAREAAGRPTVNALWIEGAGALEAPLAPNADVRVEWRLVHAGPDVAQRRAAWQALDADRIAPLLAARAGVQAVRLTLCGPQRAITLQPARGLARLRARWRPLRLDALRSAL